jgi:uracil-DNA glycosylase
MDSTGKPAPTYALTNLVACMPVEQKQDENASNEPPLEAITACAPRLKEMVRLAKPSIVVLVGLLAKKHVSGQAQFDCDWVDELHFVEIVHPAAIVRLKNDPQKPLIIKRCIVTIGSALTLL